MAIDGPIYRKFEVSRTDGRDAPGEKHENCLLFVLDLTHDPYARAAALRYAEACRPTHPMLASDLRRLVDDPSLQDLKGGGDAD